MSPKAQNALALLLAVLLCAAVPAGCGQRPGRRAQGERVVRLVTWKPNQPRVWRRVLARFERTHPGMTLRVETGPHSSTAFHDLLTQKLKNKSAGVDVFLMDVVWPAEFASAGWALPLDSRLPPAEREKFLPACIQAATYRGHVWGLPLNIDSGVFYYRRDLLRRYGEKVPRTWPEMVAVAGRVMAAERRAGRRLWGLSAQLRQYEGLVCDMLEFIKSNGGAVLDPKSGRCLLAEPPALAAVRFVRDNIVGRISPRGVLTYQEPESLALFAAGRALFMRNWPYAYQVANAGERSQVRGDVGVATLPAFPGHASSATLGGWQVGVSAFSRDPDAAWALASFLTGEQAQRIFALDAGRAPTRRAVYHDPQVRAARPRLGELLPVFLTASPRPLTPLYPAVSQVMQVYFSRALAEPRADLAALARRAAAQIDGLTALARQGAGR